MTLKSNCALAAPTNSSAGMRPPLVPGHTADTDGARGSVGFVGYEPRNLTVPIGP